MVPCRRTSLHLSDPGVPDLDALIVEEAEGDGASVFSCTSGVLPELATLASYLASVAHATSAVSCNFDVIPGLVNTNAVSAVSRDSGVVPGLVNIAPTSRVDSFTQPRRSPSPCLDTLRWTAHHMSSV